MVLPVLPIQNAVASAEGSLGEKIQYAYCPPTATDNYSSKPGFGLALWAVYTNIPDLLTTLFGSKCY
jgi:hypothetical protein